MSQDPKSKLSSVGLDFTPTIHHDTYDEIKPEQFNLDGKAIFITGASKGVGRASALSFAKAGASYIGLGARSNMSDVETEIEDAAKGAGREAPKILTLKLDVENEQSIQHAATEVEKAFGRLDFLVNNAGYLSSFVPIADSDPDDWWRHWTVHIRGPYLITRALLPLMLKGGMKTMLNISSIGAHLTAPGASGYLIRSSVRIETKFTDLDWQIPNIKAGYSPILGILQR